MILEKNNLVLRGKSVFLWTLGAIEVERRGEAVGGPFEKLVPWLSSLVEVGTVLQKPGPDDGDVGAFLSVVPSSHTDPDHQIRYRQTSPQDIWIWRQNARASDRVQDTSTKIFAPRFQIDARPYDALEAGTRTTHSDHAFIVSGSSRIDCLAYIHIYSQFCHP